MSATPAIVELEAENWKAIRQLPDHLRGSLLCYLCGFFENNQSFQDAVAWWLKAQGGDNGAKG